MTLDEFRDEHNGATEDQFEYAQLIIDNLTDMHLNEESLGLYEAARSLITSRDKFEQAMLDADLQLG